MSTIQNQLSIIHQDTNTSFQLTASRTAIDSGFSVQSIEFGTTEATIDVSDFDTPHHIMLRLLSGDDLKVGISTGVYPFRLSGADDFLVLRPDIEGLVETQTITTIADVSDSLDGTYVTLEGASGTWAIWIDTDDSGTAEPAHGLDASVEVTGIATDATAAQVAAAIYAALIASTAFMADFDVAYNAATDDDFITITDKHVGTRTNLADTGSTGFTVATTQAGAAQVTIYVASAGTSQVLVGIAPD